jgi:hypothetical protein
MHREKPLDFNGRKSRPETGSPHRVATNSRPLAGSLPFQNNPFSIGMPEFDSQAHGV